MKIQLIPYLNFDGKCREAMMFYQQCLGGELSFQKIAESPMAVRMPSKAGANILHSKLTTESILLMASDVSGDRLVTGNAVVLCIHCSNKDEIYAYFSSLSKGGQIKTPLHQTFWGATYGEVTDKFGMNWMFNFLKN